MNRKRVLVIYTGGTRGMVAGENGYIPARKTLEEAMKSIWDLNHDSSPEWVLMSFEHLLDSSDMTVADWNRIGQIIASSYEDYDGFVVLHGTDTMAYTASALSFMLENLNKPVILTGSQIPLSQLRSDGRDNLVNSVFFAASDMIHEVCLYFHGTLYRGNRSTKMSADRLGAFSSPNYPVLAEAGVEIQYHPETFLKRPEEPFRLQLLKEFPIGVIKIFPGIQFELFEPIMTEKLHGIVLETFGAGNIPTYENSLLPIIRKAYEHDSVIVVCTQCPQGTVSLGTYEASNALVSVGAVSGYDITTEAAVTKLYYLFSKEEDTETIRKLMSMNIRGEISVLPDNR